MNDLTIIRKEVKNLKDKNTDLNRDIAELDAKKMSIAAEVSHNLRIISILESIGLDFQGGDRPPKMNPMIEAYPELEILNEVSTETIGVTDSYDEWVAYIQKLGAGSSESLLGGPEKYLTIEARGAKRFVTSVYPLVDGKPVDTEKRRFESYSELCVATSGIPYISTIIEHLYTDRLTLKTKTVYDVVGVFKK